MDTPICDFVRSYAQSDAVRMHMPGHKGAVHLGCEHLDITEIDGADSLYEASGVIAKSEENAGSLFGCKTYYSTEGSSQCIRAMLHLAMLYGKQTGKDMRVLAYRNAHKTFLSACALLDLEIDWLYGKTKESYLSCVPDAKLLLETLRKLPVLPMAVYVTSPDYLGNMADIAGIADVCHRFGLLLLVDNAHGAYLKFLPESQHPMDLGADISCDSAHKTLPVLTGGAYLHVSSGFPACIFEQAKNALSLFGSTSPSYLILQSLDAVNRYLVEYPRLLNTFLAKIKHLANRLVSHGYCLVGNEPMKITISTKSYGYTGQALASLLRAENIFCEFADPDYLVLMPTPELDDKDLNKLESVLLSVPPLNPISIGPPVCSAGERVLSVREAMLSLSEVLPATQCIGRVLASAGVGCPPAVPILVCGERIGNDAIRCFKYYGVDTCAVVKE